MAAGDTSLGTGATFEWNDVAPKFAIEVTSISIDGPECGVVDKAHLGTTALHPKLACELLEPGTLTVEGYFKSDYDMDNTAIFVGATDDIKITTGSGSVWTWTAAIMTGFSANIPLEDVETCTATFQLNSALTVA
jgi:hypothetical protein